MFARPSHGTMSLAVAPWILPRLLPVHCCSPRINRRATEPERPWRDQDLDQASLSEFQTAHLIFPNRNKRQPLVRLWRVLFLTCSWQIVPTVAMLTKVANSRVLKTTRPRFFQVRDLQIPPISHGTCRTQDGIPSGHAICRVGFEGLRPATELSEGTDDAQEVDQNHIAGSCAVVLRDRGLGPN
jgi:hypothetical protein